MEDGWNHEQSGRRARMAASAGSMVVRRSDVGGYGGRGTNPADPERKGTAIPYLSHCWELARSLLTTAQTRTRPSPPSCMTPSKMASRPRPPGRRSGPSGPRSGGSWKAAPTPTLIRTCLAPAQGGVFGPPGRRGPFDPARLRFGQAPQCPVHRARPARASGTASGLDSRASKSETLWYYRSLVTAYRANPGHVPALIDELDRTVAEMESSRRDRGQSSGMNDEKGSMPCRPARSPGRRRDAFPDRPAPGGRRDRHRRPGPWPGC